jgi:hypothetical protein
MLNEFDSSLLAGFGEPVTFVALRAAHHKIIPRVAGVYAVIYPFESEPVFQPRGTGGWFKKRNPNLDVQELEERWVPDSRVLYFGRAGAPGESGQLHDRITRLSRFGRGVKVGHWGGRLLWQIDHSAELLVRWRRTPDDIPRRVEHRLMREFVSHYCKMPFANLVE